MGARPVSPYSYLTYCFKEEKSLFKVELPKCVKMDKINTNEKKYLKDIYMMNFYYGHLF